VSASQSEIVTRIRKVIPINGSASGPSLNFHILLATGACVCLEIILSVHFLGQYHPHDEFRSWLSNFLEPKFVSNLRYFVTCVHAEVIHSLINNTDQSAIFACFFFHEKYPYGCFKLLEDNQNHDYHRILCVMKRRTSSEPAQSMEMENSRPVASMSFRFANMQTVALGFVELMSMSVRVC